MSILWRPQITTYTEGHRVEFFNTEERKVTLNFQDQDFVFKVQSVWVSLNHFYLFLNCDEGKSFIITENQGIIALTPSDKTSEAILHLKSNPIATKIVQFLNTHNLLSEAVAAKWRTLLPA